MESYGREEAWRRRTASELWAEGWWVCAQFFSFGFLLERKERAWLFEKLDLIDRDVAC